MLSVKLLKGVDIVNIGARAAFNRVKFLLASAEVESLW